MPINIDYDDINQTVKLTPISSLKNSTTYTVILSGGDSGLRGLNGNTMDSDIIWSFRTERIFN